MGRCKRYSLGLLLLAAILVLFLRLGHFPLYYDEATYAQVSKEILQTGWWTLHVNGEKWFLKPPLFFWATALMFQLFGASEFCARVVSALSGVVLVGVTYLMGKNLYGRAAGLLAGLILLTSPLFVFFSRFGSTDVALTLCITLALYGYLRSAENPRYWLLAWLSCASAVLIKGVAGLVAPPAIVAALLLEGRLWSALRVREFILGVLFAVTLAASWHVGMYVAYRSEFLNAYFMNEVVNRASSDMMNSAPDRGFYLRVLWRGFAPWAWVAPLALLLERNRRTVSLAAVSFITFALYTSATTKFAWYILPALPALAVITAGFFVTRTPARHHRLALAVVMLLSAYGISRSITGLHSRPSTIEPAMRLAKIASHDSGYIMTAPEQIQTTVRYYSGRNLCTDAELNPLSHRDTKPCGPGEARHIIFTGEQRTLVEARLKIRVLAEDDGLFYAEVDQAD